MPILFASSRKRHLTLFSVNFDHHGASERNELSTRARARGVERISARFPRDWIVKSWKNENLPPAARVVPSNERFKMASEFTLINTLHERTRIFTRHYWCLLVLDNKLSLLLLGDTHTHTHTHSVERHAGGYANFVCKFHDTARHI